VALTLACVTGDVCAQPTKVPVKTPAITAGAVLAHTKVLASDEYEGRAPGTKGEDLSVAYIAEEFRKAGVKPAGADGSYFQPVPLVGIKADPSVSLTFRSATAARTLRFKDDMIVRTRRMVEKVSLEQSDLIFVGYGVQAPEYQWDDYKGVDLTGKTMVVLVGDPPIPDPKKPGALDPKMFDGRAMTYYGRWTYKYEMGAAKKAAAVLIVHETGPAGYPFSVLQTMVNEQYDLVAPDRNMSRCAAEGWITLEQSRALFAMAGQDFDALKALAVTHEFRPVGLGVKASMTLNNTIRLVTSRNVVGKVEGSDPVLRHQYVVFTAHWDHLGIGPEVNGDRIYHGAFDNATGIGGLIELGRTFSGLKPAPKRTLVFLAVTAEEQGLLGSEHYARAPIYPLASTLAVINMDGLDILGKTRDLTVVGLGKSDLDDYAHDAAAEQDRVLRSDPEPEKGSYFRSDHFPFAKQGVPAINAGGGDDYIGRPADWGRKMRDAYITEHYHKPSDIVRPDWDLSGAMQDLQLYFAMAWRLAETDRFPEWKAGSEFKATRDAVMKK
jgi:Zn-dependent M28 family amino/carboxypeptidase